MAAGDVKLAYAASANQTVTNLHSLASSQTWVAGWESGLIDNTTNLYEDYRVTAMLVTHPSRPVRSGSISWGCSTIRPGRMCSMALKASKPSRTLSNAMPSAA